MYNYNNVLYVYVHNFIYICAAAHLFVHITIMWAGYESQCLLTQHTTLPASMLLCTVLWWTYPCSVYTPLLTLLEIALCACIIMQLCTKSLNYIASLQVTPVQFTPPPPPLPSPSLCPYVVSFNFTELFFYV